MEDSGGHCLQTQDVTDEVSPVTQPVTGTCACIGVLLGKLNMLHSMYIHASN